MKTLADASDAELETELEGRKKQRNTMPQPLQCPDFTNLTHLVISGIKETIENRYMDDDLAQYVFEEAVTAIYGPKFWPWYNKLSK